MGTSVGSKVYNEHGWRPDAALNLAWTGFTLFILFLRGPHCPRYKWIGWEGGFELRKGRVLAREQAQRDAAAEKGERLDGKTEAEELNGGMGGETVGDEKRSEEERRRSADEAVAEAERHEQPEKRGLEAV